MSDTGASPRTEAGAGRRLDDMPRPAATIAVADDESHDIGGSINDDDDDDDDDDKADNKRAEFRGRVEMVTSMGFDSNRVAEAIRRGDGTVTMAVDWMESHCHGEGDDNDVIGDSNGGGSSRKMDRQRRVCLVAKEQENGFEVIAPSMATKAKTRETKSLAGARVPDRSRPNVFAATGGCDSHGNSDNDESVESEIRLDDPPTPPSPQVESVAAAGRREGGAVDGAGHNADAFHAAASAAPTREADESLDGTMSQSTPIEGYVAPSSPTPAWRRAISPSDNDAAAPAAATTTPPLLDDRHVVALRHDEGRGSGGRVEGDSEANMAHRKHRPLVVAVAAVCAVVIVSLAVALPLTLLGRGGSGSDGVSGVLGAGTERDSDSKEEEMQGGGSSSSSSLPSSDEISLLRPDSVRFIALVEMLTQEGVTDPDTLADRSSPQYRAAKWLADDDTNTNTTTTISLLSGSSDDVNANVSRIIIQRYVLATLYYSTGGGEGHWKDGYGFLSSASECEWNGGETMLGSPNGVSCNTDNAVSQIAVPENNMTGSLPSELGALATINFLWTSWNRISSSVPERIYDLDQLSFLWLNGNAFTGTLSSGVGKLGKMVAIWLTGNFFTGTLPTELEEVWALQNINLGDNMFGGSLPNLTNDKLPNLILFGASTNFLVGTIPEPLPLQIEFFSLMYNNITGTIPNNIPPNLKSVTLAHNNLEGGIPETLVTKSDLETLDLSFNNLRGDGVSKIGGLTNLQTLFLSDNYLSGTVPSSIGRP